MDRAEADWVETRPWSADDISILHLLAGAKLAHPAFRENLSLSHHHHFAAEAIDRVERMLHKQQGKAFARKPEEHVLELSRKTWAQARHRLVQQQELRPGHQRPHGFDGALLAAAQVARVVVRLVLHAESSEHLSRSSEHLVFALAPIASAAEQPKGALSPLAGRRDEEVLDGGQTAKHPSQLKGPDDPAPRETMHRLPGHVLAV